MTRIRISGRGIKEIEEILEELCLEYFNWDIDDLLMVDDEDAPAVIQALKQYEYDVEVC
jgi:hypothetical protein